MDNIKKSIDKIINSLPETYVSQNKTVQDLFQSIQTSIEILSTGILAKNKNGIKTAIGESLFYITYLTKFFYLNIKQAIEFFYYENEKDFGKNFILDSDFLFEFAQQMDFCDFAKTLDSNIHILEIKKILYFLKLNLAMDRNPENLTQINSKLGSLAIALIITSKLWDFNIESCLKSVFEGENEKF